MFNYTAAGRRHLGVLVWIAAALRSNTSKIIAVIGTNLGEWNLSNELKLASTYNHIWLTLAKRNTWKRMVGIMLAYAWLVVLKTLNEHRTNRWQLRRPDEQNDVTLTFTNDYCLGRSIVNMLYKYINMRLFHTPHVHRGTFSCWHRS